MTPGRLVRRLAGRHERRLCAWYRSVFVDVARCAAQIAEALPPRARVIDIGGGDGQVLNHLLRLRGDLTVTMIDRRPAIGLFLDPEVRHRVKLMPSTSLAEYRTQGHPAAEVLLVSDVVHHVRRSDREAFLRDCRSVMTRDALLLIKEVAPGGPVATLALLTDWIVTGEWQVRLVAPERLVALVERATDLRFDASLLAARERPNYALCFRPA